MRRGSGPGTLALLWMSWYVSVGECYGADVKMAQEECLTERKRWVGRRFARVGRDYCQSRCRGGSGRMSPRLVQECQRAVTVLQHPEIHDDQPSR